MDIIHASFHHVEVLAPLFDAYRQFYNQPPDLPAASAFIAERLRQRDSIILLALAKSLSEGKPLGFAQLYPSFSSVSLKRLWILNDLYVAKPARRHGVAQALLEQAKEVAVETKSKGLVLETAADNLPAKQLYLRAGWKKDLEFDRYFLYV